MKTNKNELAREILRTFPNHSIRALSKVLKMEHPVTFKDSEQARQTLRKVSGTAWAKSSGAIQEPSYVRKPAGKNVLPPIPASKAKPWIPFILPGKRVMVLSDIHLPFHSESAVQAALDHGDQFQPDTILINGDAVDFHAISRFVTNPDERDLAGELEAIRVFLAHVRARFPKARIIYKLGNHEERWWNFLWTRAPELMGVDLLTFDRAIDSERHRIDIVSDGRIIMAGKLPILHGHEWRAGISTPVNPARGAFLKAIDCALQGHLHRSSEHSESTLLGKLITCWST